MLLSISKLGVTKTRAQWLSSFCSALGTELGNGSDFLVLLDFYVEM